VVDQEYARIWERLGAIENRLRQVENIENPASQRMLAEFTALRETVRVMDVEGTHLTQVRLKALEDDVDDIHDEAKGLRLTIRSALITAAASIAVQLILYLVARSATRS
jgi:hypothetical protein